jgi:hypothetical protein
MTQLGKQYCKICNRVTKSIKVDYREEEELTYYTCLLCKNKTAWDSKKQDYIMEFMDIKRRNISRNENAVAVVTEEVAWQIKNWLDRVCPDN